MQAIDPTEVRKKLADSEEFDIENMLDEFDEEDLFPEDVLEVHAPSGQQQGQEGGAPMPPGGGAPEQPALGTEPSVEEHDTDTEGNAPAAAPAATKLPQDMSEEEKEKAEEAKGEVTNPPQNHAKSPEIEEQIKKDHFYTDANSRGSVGIYVVKDGKVLIGTRGNGDGANLICGPGGHIEEGETPAQAAIRETQEEFSITPMELIPIGKGDKETGGLQPNLFLCIKYEGTPQCDNDEMRHASFRDIDDLLASGTLFPPFESGLKQLVKTISGNEYSPENIIDFKVDSAIVKVEGNLDGAPLNNQNAAGPHNMRGGKSISPAEAKNHLQQNLKNGNLKTTLKAKEQSKHTKGSARYNKAVAEGQYVSTINVSNQEVQSIINQHSGKGKVFENNGQFKETFEHSKVFGTYMDRNGKAFPTNRGTIHYSRKGSHLVPAMPKKRR